MHDFLTSMLPDSLPGPGERLCFLALAISVSAVLVSIAVSQILLAVAVFGTLWLWYQGRYRLSPPASGAESLRSNPADKPGRSLPPIVLPLAIFFLWTAASAVASTDVLSGLTILKKFFLFLILLLIPLVLPGYGKVTWTYHAIFAASALSSAKGLLQFAVNPNRDLLHRISGFMSQWMTYSGLLMLVLVALAAYAASFGWLHRKWVIPLGLILAAPLYLSETRNAWLGAVVGLAVVLLLSRPRAVSLLILMIGALYVLSPASIQLRVRSGFDTADPNTRNRIELFETSIRLIRDNPWLGVGPRNVSKEALRYRGNNDFPDWMYQHMHNNFLQIAAERGIPGLLLWLWLMGRLAWDALLLFRFSHTGSAASSSDRRESMMISLAALGAWAALLTSGMFEYNFGDSEVLTLFLFIVGAPYALLNTKGSLRIEKRNTSPDLSI